MDASFDKNFQKTGMIKIKIKKSTFSYVQFLSTIINASHTHIHWHITYIIHNVGSQAQDEKLSVFSQTIKLSNYCQWKVHPFISLNAWLNLYDD